MNKYNYIILGAGGFAREAALHIIDYELSLNHGMPDFLFVDDVTSTKSVTIKGITYKVVKDWQFPENFTNFIIGIGDPKAKMIMAKKAFAAKLKPNKTIIHPRALVQDAVIGLGGIVTPGVIATTNISIGDFVVLNLNTTIGHDCKIEDFVTCNPLTSISGNVVLEEASFIGSGATILEKTTIGKNSIIGAQACVTKSVPNDSTFVGVPAKKMLTN